MIREALSHLDRKKLERNARMTVLREGANWAGQERGPASNSPHRGEKLAIISLILPSDSGTQ